MPDPPSDIVDGPRKRHPTKRVTENSDPHIQKKAKTRVTKSTSTAKVTSTTTKATTLEHRASIEDVAEPNPVIGPQLHHSSRVLEAADGSDDNHDTKGMPPREEIDSEDKDNTNQDTEPEDDDAELGKSSYTIFLIIQLIR
jgi:hypothetical protein